MTRKAVTLEDVILGEAKAGSLRDMLGIASVIANRAKQAGTSIKNIISAPGQFNAYGKSLPPGVEKFRDTARKAIETVQTKGPVTSALYYATPAASKNLPKGLEAVAETDGHRYFTDPQSRPFATATGYVTPRTPSAGLLGSYERPMTAPDAYGTNQDLQLEDRPLSRVIPVGDYNPSAGRSLMPTTGVVQDVQQAVTHRFGPGYSVGTFSGQEPHGVGPIGSPRNHPGGWAVDVDIVGPDGKRLDMSNPNDAAAMRQVQLDLAAQGHGIGYGPGYMAPGRMHVGTPPGSPIVGWGAKNTRLNMDPQLYADLAQAKRTGVNLPDVGPVPAARPDAGLLAAVNPPSVGAVESAGLLPARSAPNTAYEMYTPAMRNGLLAQQEAQKPAPAPQPVAAPQQPYELQSPAIRAALAAQQTPVAQRALDPLAVQQQGLLSGVNSIPVPTARPNLVAPPPVQTPPPVQVQPPTARPVVHPPLQAAPTPSDPATLDALGRQMQRELSTRKMAGGIVGGLLGGLLLGPVGAVGGGLLGRHLSQTTYYPPAPTPANPSNRRSDSGSGYSSLSDYGKEAYSKSSQVRSAVDSGKSGLW